MPKSIVVIGFSAGGLLPFVRIIRSLPSSFPAGILVCSHLSIGRDTRLPEILGNDCLPSAVARDGEPVEPGRIYVSRPGYHLLVRSPGVLALNLGPKEDGFRPSIDASMRSAAGVYGRNTCGIILSGALYDGTKGLLEIKRRGGVAIVQDLREAEYPWMPISALQNDGKIDHMLRSDEIAGTLIRIFGEGGRK